MVVAPVLTVVLTGVALAPAAGRTSPDGVPVVFVISNEADAQARSPLRAYLDDPGDTSPQAVATAVGTYYCQLTGEAIECQPDLVRLGRRILASRGEPRGGPRG